MPHLTAYHSKYLAHDLTRRCASCSEEKLATTVACAQVDLNPHQVDAALFAFRSPLSKGALLADEVGLGKTIEAGLVISQKWAERKRHILIVTPSNLRKQWHQELGEKFFLPCVILESGSYKESQKMGVFHPFDMQYKIVICSYQFARNKAQDIRSVPWDMVVIDEAHRLRNVYKPSNVIANTLRDALGHAQKLLLTATPLQNSLLELYGLTSFIDEHVFGDLKSFREQFVNSSQDSAFNTLKERIKPLCHRTLRRQVTPYVLYTKRLPLVEEFTPNCDEDRLYQLVSEYLRRDNLQALPSGQRSLMTLVLRKLLASSTFAIAGALTTLSNRLKDKLHQRESSESLEDELDQDYEGLNETADEWDEDGVVDPLSETDRKIIEAEIADLDEFTHLATSIQRNSKGTALLKALDVAFKTAKGLGSAEKAIIFTESRRTQNYLLQLLTDSPFSDGIVLFNGTNTDERSKEIYSVWKNRHEGSDRVTGSRTADMRSALVDYFREQGRIMIATEAGAEGINLQFCSLIVNYDLPWNPQRIEQRIGRCHRYGQKHDVVVVNFLNRKNEADQRVFKLLSEKFQLFEGVFGASDEILGAVESGIDFERRIADIFQECRQPEEIKTAFDQLQCELSQEISQAMTQTRQKLLENFDDEVREKLKIRDEASKVYVNNFEQRLMQLTRQELDGKAEFIDTSSFRLISCPFPEYAKDIPLGLYELPRRSGDAHLYRLGHPLADTIVAQAKSRDLPTVEIFFDYDSHEGQVTILEPLRGQSGWLTLSLFSVESLDQLEDHILLAGITDSGDRPDVSVFQRLLTIPGQVGSTVTVSAETMTVIDDVIRQSQTDIQRSISERNVTFFDAEALKLDNWADDIKAGLERELKELDRQIREARRAATITPTLEEKLAGQKQVKALESTRNQRRRGLFDAQDNVDRQREDLIAQIEGKLEQRTTCETLFTVRWVLQ